MDSEDPEDNQFQRRRILNLQDKDGNTILHIAASNNQPQVPYISSFLIPVGIHFILNEAFYYLSINCGFYIKQMIKRLIKCKDVDRNTINQRGLTALKVLQRQTLVDSNESLQILNRVPSRFWKFSRFETKFTDHIREMTPDTINALQVVFALVIIASSSSTATAAIIACILTYSFWFFHFKK